MIYLNNAAAGWPKAPGVSDAVRTALENAPAGESRDNGDWQSYAGVARRLVARLLSVDDPSRIVFTLNATHALNLALRGLELPRGALVLTSAASHNSVLRPLAHMRSEGLIRLTIVPVGLDGGISLAHYEAALSQGPSLVVLTHASNVTGHVDDIAPLFRRAKAIGAVTLLDASQTAGIVRVSPDALQADLVAFQAYKGLHGPEGVGLLYVGKSVELKPVVTGGTGVRSDLELHPSEMPIRLEAGTSNTPALAGLAAALAWHEREGAKHAERGVQWANRIREALSETKNVKVFGPGGDSLTTPVVSFQIAGLGVEEVGFILRDSFGIVARAGLHCAPLVHQAIGSAPEGTVRLSPSGFNTSEEVETAIAAVREVARCGSSR